jgi:hypothetical protein
MLFNTKWAIFSYIMIFDEIMIMSALYWTITNSRSTTLKASMPNHYTTEANSRSTTLKASMPNHYTTEANSRSTTLKASMPNHYITEAVRYVIERNTRI